MMRLGLQTALHSLRQPRLLTIGTGNGTTTSFTQPPQVTPGTAIYVNDWQGNQLQYSTPRTNLLTYSDLFTNWSLVAATLTASGTAPDGSTATVLTPSTANTLHYVGNTPAASTNYTYTNSFWAKYNGYNVYCESKTNDGSFWDSWWDLTNGVAHPSPGITGSITPFPNGWYLCEMTYTGTTAVQPVYTTLFAADATGAPSFAGDGTSGIYIFGAQTEPGSIRTSYIPTTTAAVTQTDYSLSGGNIVFAVAPPSSAEITATV